MFGKNLSSTPDPHKEKPMPSPIKLTWQTGELQGEFNDSPAGQALAAALPLTWQAQRWGEEYYGNLDKPVGEHPGPMQENMAVGDLAWYAPNNWFCLFFGPTPMSTGPQPRAAVPVQKVGTMQGDWDALSALGPEITFSIERA
jgi:hypothetical protein